MNRTSWSDSDLEKLTNRDNHRIRYNGFEYVWEHRLSSKWELQTEYTKKDWGELYKNLNIWISSWQKELDQRKVKISDFKENLKKTDKAIKTANSPYKTRKKVQLIKELMPKESVQFIADILQITRQAVYKSLR